MTFSEDAVFQHAEQACRRHGRGFEVESVEPDVTAPSGGFAVTLRQPKKSTSVSDQQWSADIKKLRDDIERIRGVTKVYLLIAEC
jgi:hypothetical protein